MNSAWIKTATAGLLVLFFVYAPLANAQPLEEESVPHGSTASIDSSGRDSIPDRWWESAGAMKRVTLKPGRHYEQLSLAPAQLSAQLDRLQAQGFTAVEIFAPADGGWSYGGLDSRDRYRLDPEVGTMEDFRRLVRIAHGKGMAIITLDNLGYCAVDAPHFLKACDAIREGKEIEEVKWFCWSDSADAPPPAQGNNFFMVRPTHLPGKEPGTTYDSALSEYWQYSDRAEKYYWTKWRGKTEDGSDVRLPQYNWSSEEFQAEAEKVVRFWMDTGIDGMVIDAVNWYIGCTWEMNRKRMTDVIAKYGNAYMLPEGGGGFHEDPVAWITEGGWNSVEDYGLRIWWEKGSDVIKNAIESGDPRPFEKALRDYHDRVVAAGGTLYYQFTPPYDNKAKQRLLVAAVAAAGDMPVYSRTEPDAEETWILKVRSLHPALQQLSTRRKLETNADEKFYAFVRTAPDGSERVLVVLNFQPERQNVTVDLSGIHSAGLVDLRGGDTRGHEDSFTVDLPAYGYRFFLILSPE